MRVLFYVDTGGATGGPGMHSVRMWRGLREATGASGARDALVGPLVVPSEEERIIFAEQLGAENVRVLGVSALVDADADPVELQTDFFARLCALARREECDHIHMLWGFLHPAQIDAVPVRDRIPVTVTLCDATAKGEDADIDAMFFGSDRWERYLREVLRAPVGYLSISDKTRKDALAKGVPEGDIETVHLWVDPALASLASATSAASATATDDYVAFVGGLAEYKGTGHLLDFALLYPEYRVKIAGYPASDFPIDWARYPSVEYLGYLPYADVIRLVQRARALLYLSYSEGFGLPMIEAQTLGVPLIVNPRNVMVRELLPRGSYVSAGNVASPTSIKAAIDVATRDRAELVARGRENAARYDETRQLAKMLSAMTATGARLRSAGWAT